MGDLVFHDRGREVHIHELLPDAKERRRYALLQAAAVLVRYNLTDESLEVEASVDEAELLLAEIEKREKAEAES